MSNNGSERQAEDFGVKTLIIDFTPTYSGILPVTGPVIFIQSNHGIEQEFEFYQFQKVQSGYRPIRISSGTGTIIYFQNPKFDICLLKLTSLFLSLFYVTPHYTPVRHEPIANEFLGVFVLAACNIEVWHIPASGISPQPELIQPPQHQTSLFKRGPVEKGPFGCFKSFFSGQPASMVSEF